MTICHGFDSDAVWIDEGIDGGVQGDVRAFKKTKSEGQSTDSRDREDILW